MEAHSVTDRSAWDLFLASQPEAPFLQSWAWGAFQEALGRRVLRLGVAENDRLLGVVQAVHVRLSPGFSALVIARGPVVNHTLPLPRFRDVLHALLAAARSAACTERVTFLRVLPAVQRGTPAAAFVEQALADGTRVPPAEPADSLLLDLAPPLDELRAALHPKTRYNIGLAERRGVQIERHVEHPPVETFLRLLHATARRDRIRLHPKTYYRTMLRVLSAEGVAAVWTASLAGTALAANIVLHAGDTVTYLHGASGNEHRDAMAPHLLQWHQIRWAREEGVRWYDFWGIAPPAASPEHPWAGITRFKRGFGGEERHYLAARELPIRPFPYRLFRLLKRLRP